MQLNPEVFREAIRHLRNKEYGYIGCCFAIDKACKKLNLSSGYYYNLLDKAFYNYEMFYWGRPNKDNIGERVIALETLALICEGEIKCP